ncbi:Tannase/feruloyl esterase [Aspergillus stella-maris]|uniref:Tannase/feruloyl esterase n=1 Tax=Aspergillus stella-maris TaxID=1810926 RepID=UPI003CCD2307
MALMGAAHASSLAPPCSPHTFDTISLFGGEILSISATPLHNVSGQTSTSNFDVFQVTNLDVCQVNVTYTHPGQKDFVNVTSWLPLQRSQWNGRFLATGGGGYASGSGAVDLLAPASLGYASASTDGGHTSDTEWAFVSPGNINWAVLQNFGGIALDDLAVLGKAITEAFYSEAIEYSYFSGCSTGGRQGHTIAQRYPTQFDGILATAPAINWASFILFQYWPQLVMNLLGEYPSPCELDAITEAAVQACDALDGNVDQVISSPGLCDFDPFTMEGKVVSCPSSSSNSTIQVKISHAATIVAKAAWTGPSTVDGKFSWYGLNPDAPLSSGLAGTQCNADQTNCTAGTPFSIPVDWMNKFVLKKPIASGAAGAATLINLTHAEYDTILRQSVSQFESILSANDPDLTDLRNAGGKMLTWHGLSDQLIPPNGTYNYYDRVLENDPSAGDYYRFFPAPGVQHCDGGKGIFPRNMLDVLVDWVENGVVPERVDVSDGERRGVLCPYPKQLVKAEGGSDSGICA